MSEDILGLDQTLKLSTRAKVPRLDNERILDKRTGVAYLIANHSKVTRTLDRNDKHFQKKYAGKKIPKSAKFEHEYENLASVLQFYQLWCHGLFPKAKFKDCIHLLRALGGKPGQLKLYRRELIDIELEKVKEAAGVYGGREDAAEFVGEETAGEGTSEVAEATIGNVPGDDSDEDDWSFMHRPRILKNNGLFVGDDDDDLYLVPAIPVAPSPEQNITGNLEVRVSSTGQAAGITSTEELLLSEPNAVLTESTLLSVNPDEDDPFSDDDLLLEEISKKENVTIAEEYPDEEDFEDYDMELMREFAA